MLHCESLLSSFCFNIKTTEQTTVDKNIYKTLEKTQIVKNLKYHKVFSDIK